MTTALRDTYRAGRARIGEATPQTDPTLFSSLEIKREIKHLTHLQTRYGDPYAHYALAIVKLYASLADARKREQVAS